MGHWVLEGDRDLHLFTHTAAHATVAATTTALA